MANDKCSICKTGLIKECHDCHKEWNITNDMESTFFICISRIVDYEDLDESHLLQLLQ